MNLFETADAIGFPVRLWLDLTVALFGACIGSFLNVCIYRIPRDESVVHPRSHCPSCGRLIPWHLNIPLVSWLALRGRCRFCRAPITIRYWLVEVLVAVLFCLVWNKFAYAGEQPLFGMLPLADAVLVPIYWLVVSGLVLGTFVDFEHLIIPDRVTLGGIVAGVVLSVAFPVLHGQASLAGGALQSALGLALGWGMLWSIAAVGRVIFKREAMGFGDVKLMGAIGAFFGWRAVLFTLVVSSFVGSVVGITFVLAKQKNLQSRIPYGPYIALATLFWMLWGDLWWQAYVNLITPASLRGL